MGMTDLLKSYLESTIRMMVDIPDEVKIEVSTTTKTILVQIKTAKSDFGKIIGRKGKSIEALKIITCAVKNTKFRDDARSVVLEILEDETSGFKAFRKD